VSLPEIKGFLETSFVDWAGRVAAVVFLPRCNFRCPYCHNHALVRCPESLRTFAWEEVLERLEAMRGWVDGVCVTGGEPTVHEGLPELLRELAGLGWPGKLDTNGSRPEVLEGLLASGTLEAASVDVKAPLEHIPYRRNAGPGADPGLVLRSLELLAGAGIAVEARTTVHPALLSRGEVLRLAEQVGAVLGRCGAEGRFTLQRCRVEDTLDPALRDEPPLDPEEFEHWAQAARGCFVAAGGSRA